MAATTIAVIAAAVFLLLWPLLRIGHRPKGLPPGPPTVPVLGNIHLLPGMCTWNCWTVQLTKKFSEIFCAFADTLITRLDRDVHLQYQKWAQEYGPIYSLIFGTKTMIVLSDGEVVRDLLDKRSAIYSDRQEHYLAQEILSGGNRMAMLHYGPVWRTLRRMVHNSLNISKSESYVPYQDLENKQMLFELLTQPEDFLQSLRRYTMSLTSSIVYGIRTPKLDDPRLTQLFDVLETFTELIQNTAAALLEVFPLLRFLPDALLPIRKKSKVSHTHEMALFGTFWRHAKRAAQAKASNPCLAADMATEYETEGISDDVAAYTCGSILEAGADTTSNTLYAFMQAMILYPEVQKKIQKALDEVVGSDRLPSMNDYAQLPYIRGVVKESTRWFPAAILGFPHAVMEDDTYRGYRIPKGSGIICNVYTIHNDLKRFPNSEVFDPDRFASDNENLAHSATNAERRGTWVFGAGRRSCQGLHVAERSLFLAIVRILWAFDIGPAKNENGQDVMPDPTKLTQGFVCMPAPYKATIRPRSTEKAELIRKIWEEAQTDLDPTTKEWR